MRTNDPRRSASINLLLALVAASGTVAACNSLHLSPESGATTTGAGGGGSTSTTTTTGAGGATTTTTTTTTGATGGGGSAPGECKSNSDCAFPNAVCDAVKGSCVECGVFSDCAFRPGTVCSQGSCVCPNLDDSGKPDPAFAFCSALGAKNDRCVNIQTSVDDCGECGHACFGSCNAGACADPWEPTSVLGAPSGRRDHVAVWDPTDQLMVVWGGFDGAKALDTGAIYDPKKRVWTKTSMVDAPSPRFNATAVWDDITKTVIVWGGQAAGAALGTGGIFDPKTNTWKPLPLDVNAPSPRWNHTAVWTGASMIVWGGFDGTALGTGAVYESNLKGWTPMIAGASPVGRTNHSAVWRPSADASKSNMFVWGGFDGASFLNDGATYKKATGWDSNPTAFGSPPSPRSLHSAVFTGSFTLIWGGADAASPFGDGASHKGDLDGVWAPISPAGVVVPEARQHHTAVWINNRMIIWGGDNAPAGGVLYNNGFSVVDVADAPWIPLPIVPIPGRARHTAVVDNAKNAMIIWGGVTDAGVTNTGAIYTAN